MVFTAILCAVGLFLWVLARPIANLEEQKRSARLRDLENGEDEQFFEERRSLQAYPFATSPTALRLLGTAMILLGLIQGFEGGV
jgi:hypothetical protein